MNVAEHRHGRRHFGQAETHVALTYSITSISPGAAETCEQILRSLPEWFGIEEAIVSYRKDI